MKDSTRNKASFVFDKVRAKGATADLIIDEGQSLNLKVFQGELSEHLMSSAQVFGVRTIKNGKVGIAHSEADDNDALEYMVDEALNNSSFSEDEPNELILANKDSLRTDDSLLFPKDETSIVEKINFITDLETELCSKDHIKSVPYNSVGSSQSQRSYFSTAGLEAFSRSKSSFAYAYGLAEKEGKNAVAFKAMYGRCFSALDKNKIIEHVSTVCGTMLKGVPLKSGKYDVVFDSENLPQVVAIFTQIFSAKSAKDGLNPWRNKLGEVVTNKGVTVVDRPRLKEGYGYKLFDSEGVATKDLVLVDKGEFKSFIHNSSTAQHYKTVTTGHGARSARSGLGVGLHQLTINPGDVTEADLTSGEYLEVTKLDGLHSGANVISGDFSFGASGYLKKDGKLIQVVRGITVAGNFYDMLKDINAIGDTAYWNASKSVQMPLIRFSKLAISGV